MIPQTNTIDVEEKAASLKSLDKVTHHTEEAQETSFDDENQNTNAHTHPENEGLWHNPRGWATVFSAFLVNFSTFGMIFQWGNYQQLYLHIFGDQTNTFRISFVGTIGASLLFGSGIFLTPMIQKLGFRWTIAIGALIGPMGLIAASFATSPWQLYFSQGILFGFGTGISYCAVLSLPSQFFIKNRSLVSGIAFSGSGFGGLAISPMTDKLVQHLGYRNALRVEGAVAFVLLILAAALAFSTGRPSQSYRGKKSKPWGFIDTNLLNRDLVALIVFCFLITFVYLVPFFLIPQYATYLGHTPSDGARLVSLMSATNSTSRIVMGFLGDRLGNLNTMVICSLISGISNSVVWQLSSDYNIFTAFCVLYGLTGGVYLSFLPVLVADILGIDNMQRGIAMCLGSTLIPLLIGPPVTGLLYQEFGWTSAIQFVGAVTIFATMALVYVRVRKSEGKIFVIV